MPKLGQKVNRPAYKARCEALEAKVERLTRENERLRNAGLAKRLFAWGRQ